MLKIKITKIATIVLTLVIILSTMVSGAENFRPNIDFDIGGGRQNAMKIASSQVYNILYTVKTNVGSISDLNFYTSYNSLRVELFTCSPGLDVIPSDVDTNGGANVDYSCSSSSGLGSGKYVYEERYNAPSTVTVANAKASLSNALVSAQNTNGIVLTSTCVTFTATLMGDINGDDQISASDALLALQASTQSITLTPAQALAADVDRNGAVSAVDSMLILQYTTAKIASFWGKDTIAPIPTGETDGIINGHAYRVSNVFSGKYMKPTSSTSFVKQFTKLSSDNSNAYIFIFKYMGNGEYKIKSKYYSTVLALNSDGGLVLSTDTAVSEKRWYIAKSGSSYYIINKSLTGEFLSVEGRTATDTEIKSSKNISGNLWGVSEALLTIQNYYDNGLTSRWNSYGTTASNINSYMTTAQGFFSDIFGFNFNVAATTSYQSSADTCTGTATTAALNAQCSHYTTFTPTTPSHKDIFFMENTFVAAHPGNTFYLPIMWTGHFTWGDDTPGATVYNYGDPCQDGAYARGGTRIIMQNIGYSWGTTFLNNDRIGHTVLHELSHVIGSIEDSYCFGDANSSDFCGNIYCWKHGTDGNNRPKDCLMASQTHEFSYYTNENMLCPTCKSLMEQRIVTKYY